MIPLATLVVRRRLPSQQNVQFDAFGGNNTGQQMMGHNNMAGMNNMFGNMSMQQQQQPAMMNGGGMMGMQQPMGGSSASDFPPAPAANDDDDFGDFEDAAPKKEVVKSSDPLGKLISLDSLTKNTKKEDKLNEPVVATPAALNFVNQQQQIQHVNQTSNAAASFQGIDGLNKPMNFEPKKVASTRQAGKPIMASDGTVEKSGTSELIGMMSPQVMMGQPQQQQHYAVNNAAMQQQLLMQQQLAMQQQMMMQQQQMGGAGMMNPNYNNMQGGMGMPNQQMMMNNQQMGGGMMNPNMQGGMGMNGMQGGMGQPQGGNFMGGQPSGSGQMGGQPMGGGWQ